MSKKITILAFLIVLFGITGCKKNYNVTIKYLEEEYMVSVSKNTQINELEKKSVAGYLFKGFYKDSAYENKIADNETIENNCTIYALYEKEFYNVQVISKFYNKNYNVKNGDYYSSINLPEVEGYTFKGFFSDEQYKNKIELTNIVTGDACLYANYSVEKRVVHFETNGGSEIKDYKVDYNRTIENVKTPNKLWYEFSYWSTDMDGKNKFDLSTPITDNITLYANYQKVDYNDYLNLYIPDEVNKSIDLPMGTSSLYFKWISSDTTYFNNGIYLPGRTDKEIEISLTIQPIDCDDSVTLSKKTIIKKYELPTLVSGDIVIGYSSTWYYKKYSSIILNTVDVLDVSFAYVNADGTLDLESVSLMLLDLVGEAHKNGIRVCLSVQGYGDETVNYSNCANDDTLRAKLVSSMIEAVKTYHLDGIDIDWEYPGFAQKINGIDLTTDKINYTKLMKELRTALDELGDDYLLTAAIPAGQWGYNNFEMKELCNYFDYFNMMSYDLENPTCGSLHCAIYPSKALSGTTTGSSIDETITYWSNLGVPLNKICLGIAFYGKYLLVQSNINGGLGSSSAYLPNYKNQTYSKIRETKFSKIGSTVSYYWDKDALVPYLIVDQSCQFFTYENERSVLEKCAYAKEKKLAGVMIWELGEDDTNTLITAVAQGMGLDTDGLLVVGGRRTIAQNECYSLKAIDEILLSYLDYNIITEDENIVTIKMVEDKWLLESKNKGTTTVKVTSTDGKTIYSSLEITVE